MRRHLATTVVLIVSLTAQTISATTYMSVEPIPSRDVVVDELRAYRERVTPLCDPADQNRLDFQVAPHGLRIHFLPLVTKHRTA